VGLPADDADATRRPRLPVDAVLFEDTYPSDERMLEHVEGYDEVYAAYLQRRGAEPRGWSAAMARMHTEPRRTDLASYYTSKGADLG
jgi:FMN reductase (NADPH)